MGSSTLPRMRSVRREEDLTPRPGEAGLATTLEARAGDAGASGEQRIEHVGDGRERAGGAHWLTLPLAFAAPLLVPLASQATRHWLVEAGATLCVAGGFIAAPFLTVTAWIGLALPRRVLLHQASTALFLIAILWMAAALIGAHLHHHHQPAHAAGGPDRGE